MVTVLKADQTNEVVYNVDYTDGSNIQVVVEKVSGSLKYYFYVDIPDTSADYMSWSSWQSQVEGLETIDITGSLPLPGGTSTVDTGVIVMWSGLLTAIPSGWNLCNGANGTPDLRDKFIKGAANLANPGATGGSSTHTHANHANHVVTQPATHAAGVTGAASAGATQRGTTSSTITLAAHTHTTPALTHSGTAVDAHSAHDTVNHEPVYYALAFIMKV